MSKMPLMKKLIMTPDIPPSSPGGTPRGADFLRLWQKQVSAQSPIAAASVDSMPAPIRSALGEAQSILTGKRKRKPTPVSIERKTLLGQ